MAECSVVLVVSNYYIDPCLLYEYMNIIYSITRNQRNISTFLYCGLSQDLFTFTISIFHRSQALWVIYQISDHSELLLIFIRIGRKQGLKLVIVDQLLQLLTLECWRRARSSGGPSNYR